MATKFPEGQKCTWESGPTTSTPCKRAQELRTAERVVVQIPVLPTLGH